MDWLLFFVSKFVFIINIINTAPPHLFQTYYNCWANGNTCTVTHEKRQNGSQNVQYKHIKNCVVTFFSCWLQSREGWFTFDLFSPPRIPLQLHGRFFYLFRRYCGPSGAGVSSSCVPTKSWYDELSWKGRVPRSSTMSALSRNSFSRSRLATFRT